MGKVFNTKKETSSDVNKELKKLLEIADESGIEPPKTKVSLLQRILGGLRGLETSGLAEDILSAKENDNVVTGEEVGGALKKYGKRAVKGFTGQGLTLEDMSGVEGYKDVLAKRGVSDKPWFELGPIKPNTAGVLGFAGDVLLDPLNYMTGGLSKAGKAASKTATSELAQEMAEGGVRTIAREAGEGLGRTSAEQALKGQKSLLNIFGQPVVPKSVSAKAYQTFDDVIRKSSGTRMGDAAEATSKLFKTDAMPFRYKGVPELEDMWKKSQVAKTVAKNKERALAELGRTKGEELYKQAVELSGGRKGVFKRGAVKG
jgi:hypothetical protein